jgi:hypothetical protein
VSRERTATGGRPPVSLSVTPRARLARLRRAAAASAVMLAAAPGSAAAARPMHMFARAAAPLQSDGGRYVAFLPVRGRLDVHDFLTGKAVSVAVDESCNPVDGAGGYFLINCPAQSGFATPFVLDAHKGKVQPVPGGVDITLEDFGQIGRHWLRGSDSSSGRPTTEYLNWRTGARRAFGEEELSVPRDLNSASLRPLGPPTASVAVFAAGPYVVADEFRKGSGDRIVLRPKNLPTRTLDRCRRGCSVLQAGGGLVTWASGPNRARGYVLRTGHSRTWSLPTGTEGVEHTTRRLLFSVRNRSGTGYTIFAVASPR